VTSNLIVVRPAPDLPPGFLPADLDGKWFDVSLMPEGIESFSYGDAVAVPSGRFETREDGAVAEVYEVRP
jgi:hypothetical protein